MALKHQLQRASSQRFIALKNAFSTIDAFANPSLCPEEMAKYKAVKKSLLINYKLKK